MILRYDHRLLYYRISCHVVILNVILTHLTILFGDGFTFLVYLHYHPSISSAVISCIQSISYFEGRAHLLLMISSSREEDPKEKQKKDQKGLDHHGSGERRSIRFWWAYMRPSSNGSEWENLSEEHEELKWKKIKGQSGRKEDPAS